ncbi:hypothetical protein EJ03DRAFT_327756 [Teratosphaeria nubilosa]|uniref:Nucleoporin Pom152 n=1 Tax=Teratosphaeria nubilosa TaxID=161662 RepID=A0A6G1L806_9PEZI|nr:hypothetical protein EJ03DRAFT_327756 [Teratosphaeria nubilosa]
MEGTPRLKSAFPATPQTSRRGGGGGGGAYPASPVKQRRSEHLPEIPALQPTAAPAPPSEPVIPESVIDAPSQRLYAVTLFVALWAWKVYDFAYLQELDDQSLWLFMKWVALDGVFLFGLPGMRIPWLEWSSVTMTLLFMGHALADGMMMFRIPIPVGAGLAAVGRSVWGAYEMAVNEHRVNPHRIEFNESLILGRQIIHILPEGSAVLNPERTSYCLGGSNTEARLPITINSTNPTSMELVRWDLDTNANETIHITKSHLKAMHKDASRLKSYSEKPNEPKTLFYSVKKPGLYVLSKVIDESNLEVARKRMAHTVVVPCPKANILPAKTARCRGDLSKIELEVTGTPPLRVKYRKAINQQAQDISFESIQPEDFLSPLGKVDFDNAVTIPTVVDTEWARSRVIKVPLSEGLTAAGRWVYSISEVQDGFGNKVPYSEAEVDRKAHLSLSIMVHELPQVNLQGCTPQKPLNVAIGQAAQLPVQLSSTGRGAIKDTPYHLQCLFSPQDDISATGEHRAEPELRKISVQDGDQKPQISQAGLYTLQSVSTDFCAGEVLEPASCLLQNPPQPQLSINSEEMFDKCAGKPIGLRVDLDLLGTPPFDVHYKVTRKGDRNHHVAHERINGLRGQIELMPRHAGEYTYDFTEISDSVYKSQKLGGLQLTQNVKPAASASIMGINDKKTACIDEKVTFDVGFQGEGPFALEWELVHNGKRVTHQMPNITQDYTTIVTDELRDGGDYVLALKSVTDKAGCQEFLKDEGKITVRHQKPKVGFGHVDNRRSIKTLEGTSAQLPLRLAGERPWTIAYRDASGREHTMKVSQPNDRITASQEGAYELVNVRDNFCPGVVDEASKDFNVSYIPRPQMRIPESGIAERSGQKLSRQAVCEGDEDAIEVLFKGAAPYHIHWMQHTKPEHGAVAPKPKELRVPQNMATVRMDTAQAGLYTYTFDKLGDANYDHNSKAFTPITLEQRVHGRPSAAFVNPGKTYSFCSVESAGEEVIPVQFHGEPPFHLEVEIKHHRTGRPETLTLSKLPSRRHDIRIPHSRLHGGKSSVALRAVTDARGCSRILDSSVPRVHIAVHDAPTITPLDTSSDFCVGDRLNFALAGQAPFNVFYNFEGHDRKAVASSTTFRRLAETPGTFTITGIQDSASTCRSSTNLTAHIHGLPSVRVSHGKDAYVDIHEGGEAEILFEFGGEPPFEFTWTRSTHSQRKGGKGVVLDMKHEVSEGRVLRVKAGEEGVYEVVAVRDRWCRFVKPGVKVDWREREKLLEF